MRRPPFAPPKTKPAGIGRGGDCGCMSDKIHIA